MLIIMKSEYLLLDTNIVSYIMKGAREAKLYQNDLSGKRLTISFTTVGELWAGAENAKWGEDKRKKLEGAIRNFVVIPYDYEIAKKYGEVAENAMADRFLSPMHRLPLALCVIS